MYLLCLVPRCPGRERFRCHGRWSHSFSVQYPIDRGGSSTSSIAQRISAYARSVGPILTSDGNTVLRRLVSISSSARIAGTITPGRPNDATSAASAGADEVVSASCVLLNRILREVLLSGGAEIILDGFPDHQLIAEADYDEDHRSIRPKPIFQIAVINRP